MRLLNNHNFSDFIFQLARFGITGVMATVVHFSVVVSFVELEHLPPLTANLFGFLCGFVVSFTGHRFWTFSETSRTVRDSLPRFFFVATINFLGNQTLYYIALNKWHLHYIPALVFVLGFMAMITYLFSRWWAFR